MPRQPNPKNRLACDRCHSHKLRCPRQEGQGACQRCLRANATCVFSPRQKRASPSATCNKGEQDQSQPAFRDPSDQPHDIDLDLLDPDVLFSSCQLDVAMPTSHDFHNIHELQDPDSFMDTNPLNLPTDWSSFLGVATPAMSPWDYPTDPRRSPSVQFPVDITQPEPSNTDSSSSSADTPSSSSTADSIDGNETCRPSIPKALSLQSHIRRLADLAVKLYEQFRVLPPVCDDGPDMTVMASLESGEMASHLIAIDEIFKSTQTLIDIMIEFYPPDGKPCRVRPDQGTLLLLLSCTDRVLDIFELLFGHMQACLSHKFIPRMPDGKPWRLPELRIGSYTPPAPTAIAMHMLTIILMASHLFDQLQEILGVGRHGLAASTRAGDNPSFPDFTEEAKSAVTRRARSVAGDIINARRLLLSLPGMYGSASFNTFTETAVAKD
ncbi:hypothetical protein QBC37DRAFT_311788 [Rhypophila decipiens]|uniref:Zn(2)-C6 fungal-type domain-containing protein n=1 Tax=Rhypophila decipiens TaxID=261697 RepID=A0AAN6YAN9_9PEZI|nr:hypothetical protein QBC37DRAFT_311788 [Rhypophila decipiens]